MKIRLEDGFNICSGCGSLYEVDRVSDSVDHLGNSFCDGCSAINDRQFREYLDDLGAY